MFFRMYRKIVEKLDKVLSSLRILNLKIKYPGIKISGNTYI